MPMWPRKAKWMRCSVCKKDAPALVTKSPLGKQVTVVLCPRCDKDKR